MKMNHLLVPRVRPGVDTTKPNDTVDEDGVVHIVEAMYAHAVTSLEAFGLEACCKLANAFLRLSCRPCPRCVDCIDVYCLVEIV